MMSQTWQVPDNLHLNKHTEETCFCFKTNENNLSISFILGVDLSDQKNELYVKITNH